MLFLPVLLQKAHETFDILLPSIGHDDLPHVERNAKILAGHIDIEEQVTKYMLQKSYFRAVSIKK